MEMDNGQDCQGQDYKHVGECWCQSELEWYSYSQCQEPQETWHQLPVPHRTYATWQWHSPGTSNCDLQHLQLESHVTGDVFPTPTSDTKTEWWSWPLPQYLREPDNLSLLLSQAPHMMDLRDLWHHQNTEKLEWNDFEKYRDWDWD